MNDHQKQIGLSGELLVAVAQGSFDPDLEQFDEQRFLENWHLPFFIVFSFLRRYVKLDHAAAQGDLVMSMIASEIWLHNIGHRLGMSLPLPDATTLSSEEYRRSTLSKCNSHSISLALGLSPETVRRKVKKLIDIGWVEKSARGALHITAACEQVFTPEANLNTMRDFVGTARMLFNQLGIDGGPNSRAPSFPEAPASEMQRTKVK